MRGDGEKAVFSKDEPGEIDLLGMGTYARSIARLALTCDTPFTVGLHGGWGAGKTTLMHLIERELAATGTRCVWFNPWRYQYDQYPALAVIRKLSGKFDIGGEKRDLIEKIADAFSAAAVTDRGEAVPASRNRDVGTRLRQCAREIVAEVQGPEKKRIVFFIDDLDRCAPDQIAKVLESVKLFLNFTGCVTLLAFDKFELGRRIDERYHGITGGAGEYLEKVLQFSFTLPPPGNESKKEFIAALLPLDLARCASLLLSGLSDNPREAKKVINALVFCHSLAKERKIPQYSERLLALLLLLQQRMYGFYSKLVEKEGLLSENITEWKRLCQFYLFKNSDFEKAVCGTDIPAGTDFAEYFRLTELTTPVGTITETEGLKKTLELHEEWILTGGNRGRRSNFAGAGLVGADLALRLLDRGLFAGANMKGANCTLASLTNADLRKANLGGAILNRARLFDAFLAGAVLEDASLVEASMEGAILEGAMLAGANLSRADLSRGNLGGVRGERVNLGGAILRGVNFRYAQLNGANLEGADLSDANLDRANLEGAKMKGAILTGANLKEARNLTPEQLGEAVTDNI